MHKLEIVSGIKPSRHREIYAPRRRALGALERRAWAEKGNARLLDETAVMLQNPEQRGILVLARAGSGTSTLGYTFATVYPQFHVVTLAGAQGYKNTPYGVFLKFMDALPEGAETTPDQAIPVIAEAITRAAAGKSVLLFVDEIQSIDPASLAVVVHLILSDRAGLLATTSNAAEVRHELGWMMSDGLIRERQLEPLTRSEARGLIRRSTGHPISEAALGALMGQPDVTALRFQALFLEQVQEERISLRSGRWIANNHLRISARGPMGSLVASALARESERVRHGIESIALLHRAPWELSSALLGAETLIELEERGYIGVDFSALRLVSLKDPLLAEAVRAQSCDATRQQLLTSIREILGASVEAGSLEDLDRPELISLWEWLIDLDLIHAPSLRIRIATSALNSNRPLLAKRALEGISADAPCRAQAQLLLARAERSSVRLREAWAAIETIDLDALTVAGAGLEDLVLAAEVVHTRIRLYLEMYADYPAAQALLPVLGQLCERIDGRDAPGCAPTGEGRTSSGSTGESGSIHVSVGENDHESASAGAASEALSAAERLVLADLEIQVSQGASGHVVPVLEAHFQGPGSREFRYSCASLLVPVLVLTGRENDALELSAVLVGECQDRGLSGRIPLSYLEGRILAMMFSGKWDQCLKELHSHIDNCPEGSTSQAGVLELAIGMMHCFTGKFDDAVEVLRTATVQLEASQARSYYRLCVQALACALTGLGQESEAREILAATRDEDAPMIWIHQFFTAFFRNTARLNVSDLDASRDLIRDGLTELGQGRFSTASLALFGAKYYNSNRELEAVRAAGEKRQAPMGKITAKWAQAMLDHDPVPALEAAELAESLNLDLARYRCALTASELAAARGSQAIVTEARRHLDLGATGLDTLTARVQLAHGVQLTHREAQITRLAERGLGNREIAARIGISVRTVEGHLYQAFAKLGIASRAQLEDLGATLAAEPALG